MIPVLVISASGQAAAETQLGNSKQVAFDVDGKSMRWYDNGSCVYIAQWSLQDGGTAGVNASVNCDTEWNIEYDELRVYHSGSDAADKGCSAEVLITNPEVDSPPSEGFSSITGDEAGADPATCHLTDMCWAVYSHGRSQSTIEGIWAEGCMSMDLGRVTGPEPPTICSQGTVSRPLVTAETRLFDPGGVTKRWWEQKITVSTQLTGAFTFNAYAITRRLDRASTGAYNSATPMDGTSTDLGYFTWRTIVMQQVATGMNGHGWVAISDQVSDLQPPPPIDSEVIGVGIYLSTEISQTNTRKKHANGRIGINDPGVCAFYWGLKLAEVPNTTIDEPAGPVDAPPPNQPPNPDPGSPPPPSNPESGCEGFSLTDPSSWAGAGICVLVKLMSALIDLVGDMLGVLRSVLGVLGDVLGAILGLVAELGELLIDLLIPSPSSWDLAGLVNQFKTKPPFSAVDEIAGGATSAANGFAGAGGCGALFEVMPGQTLNCTQVRDAPGMSALYGLVQAALWVTTGFFLWNMASASIKER